MGESFKSHSIDSWGDFGHEKVTWNFSTAKVLVQLAVIVAIFSAVQKERLFWVSC